MTLDSFSPRELTVVIPTLGRAQLFRTLGLLSEWEIKPKVVIVVIPSTPNIEILERDFPRDLNIVIDVSKVKSQVSQRIQGFQSVKSKYVLQLDDDIDISYHSIMKMGEVIVRASNLAVSPIIVSSSEPDSPNEPTKKRLRYFKELLYKIVFDVDDPWSAAGKFNRAGVPIFVGREHAERREISADYASGGVLLHRRENLITQNYFPFSGRGDYEDLFHGLYLIRSGIEIKVIPSIQCIHNDSNEDFRQSYYNILGRTYSVLRRFNREASFSQVRLFLWIIGLCLIHSKTVIIRILGKLMQSEIK